MLLAYKKVPHDLGEGSPLRVVCLSLSVLVAGDVNVCREFHVILQCIIYYTHITWHHSLLVYSTQCEHY